MYLYMNYCISIITKMQAHGEKSKREITDERVHDH